MITKALQLLNQNNYEEAVAILKPLSESADGKTSATANYLLGIVYSLFDFPEKDEAAAKSYLYQNINSDFPLPDAFIRYARLSIDKNISLNYIRNGLEIFPEDIGLLKSLLQYSNDKEAAIRRIDAVGHYDIGLLANIIEYLIRINRWDRIEPYILRIFSGNKLTDKDVHYLMLLEGYSNLFKDFPDYEKAKSLFQDVVIFDADNEFAYSQYIGLIFALFRLKQNETAISIFDRIPVSNCIYDLIGRYAKLNIYIDLVDVYKNIFSFIIEKFCDDAERKTKAKVLYALYLFTAADIYDEHRYKREDAAALTRYLNKHFSTEVASRLYIMRCHFQQYSKAYAVLWRFLEGYVDLDKNGISLSQILDDASSEDIIKIADETVSYMNLTDYDYEEFLSRVFPDLIEKLYAIKAYSKVAEIAKNMSNKDILSTSYAFECAYALNAQGDKRAADIYYAIVKDNPQNSSALNNLGVIYERKNDLYGALLFFEKAIQITPDDEIQKANIRRVTQELRDRRRSEAKGISKLINADALEDIGYTIEFCKSLSQIKDPVMKEILLRDARECAIAVVAGQDKMATIMCGSIIEALLMMKIRDNGITEYDISEIKHKNGTNFPISQMGLNELLYVCDKEKILASNSYHLGHYVRNYRNIVHPAKEIRMTEAISHENVLTMWSVLKRIIDELFLE